MSEQTEIITLVVSIVTLMMVIYLTYHARRDDARAKNTELLIDTSVLIDARIVSIAETGFLPGKLTIPRSVIGELQFLADNADSEKRERARRGLDIVRKLQEMDTTTVEILQDGSHAKEGVDERLLALAKDRGSALCTIDYNLNKVALVEGIQVLNVNELAQQLRMAYVPGDKLTVDLTQEGQNAKQAVGHLKDGTMIVVEDAKDKVGTSQSVVITRSLQTAAGRMMFAKLDKKDNPLKSLQKNVKKHTGLGRKKPNGSSQKAPSPKSSSQQSSNHRNAGQRKEKKPQAAGTTTAQKPRRPRKAPDDNLVNLANK